MEIEKEKELEGKEAETSTALNNTPVPTTDEVANADITVSATSAVSEDDEEEEAIPAPAPAEPDVLEASAASMFTQSQVDEIAGRVRKEAREKAIRDMYARYGVNTEEEMDNLFADSQRLGTLQEVYDEEMAKRDSDAKARELELLDLKERVALLESGIDKDRYDDAKFILKGKGLDITVDTINQELGTHPEWKKVVAPAPEVAEGMFKKKETPTKISVLGNAQPEAKPDTPVTERERAMRLFFDK